MASCCQIGDSEKKFSFRAGRLFFDTLACPSGRIAGQGRAGQMSRESLSLISAAGCVLPLAGCSKRIAYGRETVEMRLATSCAKLARCSVQEPRRETTRPLKFCASQILTFSGRVAAAAAAVAVTAAGACRR